MKIWQAVVAGISSVAVGLSLASAPVQAMTYPGENGQIVFAKTIEGKTNIWRLDAKKRSTQLTFQGAHSPRWSPDGRTLLFVSEQGHLEVMSATGIRRLTQAPGFKDSEPQWSPDGSKIVFVRTALASQRSAILSINTHDLRENNVSGWAGKGGYQSPSWSPDGERLVYELATTGAPGRLLLKALNSGPARELTITSGEAPSYPSWSPDGARILFSDSSSEVYTVWPDGSHRTAISDGDSRGAVWSAGGNRIAFVEDGQISIRESDGTVVQLPFEQDTYYDVGNLAWSPDGTKLLFTASMTSGRNSLPGLFSVDVHPEAGLLPARLATGNIAEPQWQARP